MVNNRGNYNVISVSLDDNALNTINNIVDLKKEYDRLVGAAPPVGSREYITRYGRTQVLEEIINRGAPDIVREYRELLAKANKSNIISDNDRLLNPDEALKRKLFDMNDKGWQPLG